MIAARAVVPLATLSILLTGCAATGAAGDCATDVTVTVAATGDRVSLTEGDIQSRLGGTVLSVYATDYAVDERQAAGLAPEVPAGGALLWVDLGTFDAAAGAEPLEPGSWPVAGEGSEGITASLETATESVVMMRSAVGEARILELGDTACVELDLNSDELSIDGTVSSQLLLVD